MVEDKMMDKCRGFKPSEEQVLLFHKYWQEFMTDIASICGFDSDDWDVDDFLELEEKLW